MLSADNKKEKKNKEKKSKEKMSLMRIWNYVEQVWVLIVALLILAGDITISTNAIVIFLISWAVITTATKAARYKSFNQWMSEEK